jgi:hypothetical protein
MIHAIFDLRGASRDISRKTTNIVWATHVIFDSICVLIIWFIFVREDYLASENKVMQVWVKCEMIIQVLQIPYQFIIIMARDKARRHAESAVINLSSVEMVKIVPHNEKPQKIFTKSLKQSKIETELENEKYIFTYEEDFIAMTMLCYLKSNSKKYMITSVKQSQMLNSCMLV